MLWVSVAALVPTIIGGVLIARKVRRVTGDASLLIRILGLGV